MLDFGKVQGTQLINKEFILSQISDSMIFGYYFGDFKIGNKYPSAFRPDRHPSTGFYISRANKIIYNDLTSGEKLDCFDFVQKLYSCDFQTSLNRVAADFGLTGGIPKPMDAKLMKRMASMDKNATKQYVKIHFETQNFDKRAIEFWKSYHITREEVKRENIYQIKKLWINDWFIPNKNEELRFGFTIATDFEIQPTRTKIYAPENTGDLRFVSNIPNTLPFGLNTLKFGPNKLFITKAIKDKIIVQKFFPAVIASQNESHMSISDKLLKKLQFNFPEIYILWDNDEAGLKGMEKMQERGCIPLHLPTDWLKEGIKDYSDFAQAQGLKAVENFFKTNKLL